MSTGNRGASPTLNVYGQPMSPAAQAAAVAAVDADRRAKAMELAIAANPGADTATLMAAAEQFETYLRTGEQPVPEL